MAQISVRIDDKLDKALEKVISDQNVAGKDVDKTSVLRAAIKEYVQSHGVSLEDDPVEVPEDLKPLVRAFIEWMQIEYKASEHVNKWAQTQLRQILETKSYRKR